MARGNRNLNDTLQRTRSRNAAEERSVPTDDQRRKRQIRSWIILVAAVVAVLLGIHFLGSKRGRAINLEGLPCSASQDVTPFRDGLLYYDGTYIYHLSSSGAVRWSYMAGNEVKFSAGPAHVAIWYGPRLMVVDQNGKSTYTDTLEGDVQFVRVGERYIAAVIGDDTAPKLSVKNMDGGQEDALADPYNGLMLLDAGFFGDKGQYLWTLALDVFGTAPNTVLNTFQVGKMNEGSVSLGKDLTYRVIYESGKLRVFTTQQVYTYNYQCVQDTNATMLVYGWKLIDAEIPERGRARLLLAPTSQTSSAQIISELRVLDGDQDRRYTLPSSCVGACVFEGNIYAVSGTYVYRADMKSQKFFGYQIPNLKGEEITSYYGVTSDGKMLVSAGDRMYALTLPQ